VDGYAEKMWPLIVGGKSDQECWALSKVEQVMQQAKALPATINGDKGFNSVEIKDSQLTLSVPTKKKKRSAKEGVDVSHPVCVSDEDSEVDEDIEEDITDEDEGDDDDLIEVKVEKDYNIEVRAVPNFTPFITVNNLPAKINSTTSTTTTSTPANKPNKKRKAPTVDVNDQFDNEIVLKNWLIATARVTVEQYFGRLKQWATCGQKTKNRALQYFEAFVKAIVIMCNFIRKPLRK
jgi:hypothetical protein